MAITYYDPIISVRRGADTPLVEITENKKCVNSCVILSEIPSRTQKVNVTGTIGGISYIFFETPLGSTPSIDTTNYYVYFSVDYVIGQVLFPVELEGITLGFNFWGQGCHFFPISRVYSEYSDLGNGNYDILETLQDTVDHLTNLTAEGTWSASTTYLENNIVTYENFSYISLVDDNLNHTPVGDISDTYWQLLSGINNFENKGTWNSAIQYYKNNIILYPANNSTYICLSDVLSATVPPSDATHWKLLVDLTEFQHKGTWSSGTTYAVNNIVLYATNNSSYLCIQAGTNHQPDTSPTYWLCLADLSDFYHTGDWAIGTAYVLNNVVTYNSSSYMCIQSNTGQQPDTATTYWKLVALCGSVTDVSSTNADISVITGTTTPVLTLNSGESANQIVKRDSNAYVPTDGVLFGDTILFSWNAALGTVDITTV